MHTESITEETLEKYEELLPPEVADDIGRAFFHGLAAGDPPDGEDGSTMVWELKNSEDEADTESELKWMHVTDPGAGGLLLELYKSSIRDIGVVKTFFEWRNRDEITEELLEDAGFELEERESRDIIITAEEIKNLPIAKKGYPSYIKSMEELKVREFRKGITSCLLGGSRGLLEDISHLPMSWFEKECSGAVITDGEVNGMFLIHRTVTGTLMPVLLYAEEPDSRMHMLNLIRFSIHQISERYPDDTEILIRRRNDSVRALTEYFFPGRTGETVLTGERDESDF